MKLRFVSCLSVFALMAGSAFAGVQFKGMTWYHSDSPSGLLFVNGNGKLEWRPVKPHQLTVRIPEQQLNQDRNALMDAINQTAAVEWLKCV